MALTTLDVQQALAMPNEIYKIMEQIGGLDKFFIAKSEIAKELGTSSVVVSNACDAYHCWVLGYSDDRDNRILQFHRRLRQNIDFAYIAYASYSQSHQSCLARPVADEIKEIVQLTCKGGLYEREFKIAKKNYFRLKPHDNDPDETAALAIYAPVALEFNNRFGKTLPLRED
jgi:hypothetical protein